MRGEQLERDDKRRRVENIRNIEMDKPVKRQSKETSRHKAEVREGKLRESKRRGQEVVKTGGKSLQEGLIYCKTNFSEMAEKAKDNKIEVRGANCGKTAVYRVSNVYILAPEAKARHEFRIVVTTIGWPFLISNRD